MKIAYIVSGMNLTFVINELESHERAHWQVLPLASCRNTSPDNFSELMKKWHRKALYRPPFYRQLFAVIREVAANPLRFVKTLSFLFMLLVRCPTEFAKAIYELPAACYFVSACRKYGIEHIHVHFASRSLSLGIILSTLTDISVSCTVHAFDIFTRNSTSLKVRLNKCSFIRSISEYNVEYLERKCGKSIAELCEVVHCGIDVTKFKLLTRTPKPGRMICVARLDPKKGLEVAVQACEILKKHGVSFLFNIIGSGQEEDRLKEQVRSLGLNEHIKFLGPIPNDRLVEHFQDTCVFLTPCVEMPNGNMDGIPVAMMEAMACGVPVVSTRLSGIPELVEDDVTGVIVSPNNASELAERLQDILIDTDKIERFGKTARKKVFAEFSIDNNAAKLRELVVKYSSCQKQMK